MDSIVPGELKYFTGFDWLLIVLLLWSAFGGFLRGFIRSIMGLIGLIGGCFLASDYNIPVGRFLSRWFNPFSSARIAAFVLIAFVVWILFTVVGGQLKRKLKKWGLGMPDRIAGAGFGMARGLILCFGVMLALSAGNPETNPMKGSVLAPYFLEAGREVSFLIPPDMQSLIRVPRIFRPVP
jgi:membrane protein required for colicin V production